MQNSTDSLPIKKKSHHSPTPTGLTLDQFYPGNFEGKGTQGKHGHGKQGKRRNRDQTKTRSADNNKVTSKPKKAQSQPNGQTPERLIVNAEKEGETQVKPEPGNGRNRRSTNKPHSRRRRGKKSDSSKSIGETEKAEVPVSSNSTSTSTTNTNTNGLTTSATTTTEPILDKLGDSFHKLSLSPQKIAKGKPTLNNETNVNSKSMKKEASASTPSATPTVELSASPTHSVTMAPEHPPNTTYSYPSLSCVPVQTPLYPILVPLHTNDGRVLFMPIAYPMNNMVGQNNVPPNHGTWPRKADEAIATPVVTATSGKGFIPSPNSNAIPISSPNPNPNGTGIANTNASTQEGSICTEPSGSSESDMNSEIYSHMHPSPVYNASQGFWVPTKEAMAPIDPSQPFAKLPAQWQPNSHMYPRKKHDRLSSDSTNSSSQLYSGSNPMVGNHHHLSQGQHHHHHHHNNNNNHNHVVHSNNNEHRKERIQNQYAFTPEKYAVINEQVEELCSQLHPREEEREKQKNLLEFLRTITKSVFSKAELHPFGSSANGLGLTNSDMDLCVCFTDDPEHKITASVFVELLGTVIQQESCFTHVKLLTRARIPIIKLQHENGIACDIGFENKLALVNTRLLKTYSEIDPRFKKLVYIVKNWSKQRGINEPYFGTLSSYCFVLMIIHFLQQRNPPVLPCLQQIPPVDTNEIPLMELDGYNVYFFEQIEHLDRFWNGANTESVSELLFGFFHYYAYDFRWNTSVISVRTGGTLSKEQKGWTKAKITLSPSTGYNVTDRFWLCVEDPFELNHNIGRPADRDSLYEIRGEFIRAAKLMKARDLEQSFPKLFQLHQPPVYNAYHPPPSSSSYPQLNKLATI